VPHALFFLQAVITNGFGYICDGTAPVEAHSLEGLSFTNGSGSGYSQFVIQSIIHQ
jgi:hypothetical protein